ncbi:diguanylate cyclase domain-containing protein, partial [Vibrio sagamiensis]|uniref:diguanylate cyclase domain-containing protein n=1 Tax=Vibrio sagamiensis TaxID=512650 RepID=UPI001300C429
MTKKDFLKRIYINYDTLIQFINNNFRLKSPVIENKSKVLNSIVSVFNWSGVLLIASIFITGCLYYSDFKRYKELQNLDQLTGFNNRFALMSFLKKASVNDAMFKIITVRIRNLREVNHQYGSEYGDLMLQFAANSLKGIVPEKGTSFRSSGSGFIFIFNNESNISKLLKDNFKDILSEYITVRRID